MFDVTIGVVIGARPVRRGGVSQPSRRDKAAGWIVDGSPAAGGAFSTVGEDVGIYRPRGTGQFREIKAARGRRSALSWIWFRRPFHPDCIYGEDKLQLDAS
jgi:hypothetical protein